jgi:hypothetical protein
MLSNRHLELLFDLDVYILVVLKHGNGSYGHRY